MNSKKYRVSVLLNSDMVNRIIKKEDMDFLRTFAEINNVEALPESVTEEFMMEAIEGADACITCWGTPALTEAVINRAPNLKLIAHAAGSIRYLVPDSAWDRNVRVTSCAPVIAEDVAENTLGLILASLRRIPQYSKLTRQGLWAEDYEVDRMKKLSDVTIGIVGASLVGRNVINLLKPFKVKILLCDPYATENDCRNLGVVKSSLKELMSKSDVVTLHAPSIPETYHMINKSTLSLMKDGTIFINTARGSLVDEAALIDKLKQNRIFACIDVTDPEPPAADHPFRHMDNVILTPHIAGGHTINGRYLQGSYIVQQVYNCLVKGHLDYEITRDMLPIMA